MRQVKDYSLALFAGLLALLGALSIGSPAAADDYYCSGSLGADTVDNLIVSENETCTLNGTQVLGNIFVSSGATLHAYEVQVNGDIQADGAAQVNVYSGSSVGGNLQMIDSEAAVIQLVDISGDLRFDNNRQFLSADGNTIAGNLQAFENTGGVSITYNTIGANLQCTGNEPPPTGTGNTVNGSAEDQCLNFDQDPTATSPAATPIPPTATPIPPTATQTPTATATSPSATQTGPVAVDDEYTFAEDQISVPAPGILANDTFPAQGGVEVILARRPQHGILTLGQPGGFLYEVDPGYFGEDSFEYMLSSGGSQSNMALVQLTMIDEQAPTLLWTSPVKKMGQVYQLYEGEQVLLEVQASDNRSVESVLFYRWDAVNLEYVTMARMDKPPFRLEVSANSLNPGWNQVFAAATDQAGNNSDYSFIWLYKQIQVFMPLIGK